MLTRRQLDLLMFIHESLKLSGVCPSFEEMKDALGPKSKAGIHRLINALEERGFVAPYKTRPELWKCCGYRRISPPDRSRFPL